MRFFRIQCDFFCRSVVFFVRLIHFCFFPGGRLLKHVFGFQQGGEGFPLCWRFLSLVKAMGFSGFPNLERSIFETNQPRALGGFWGVRRSAPLLKGQGFPNVQESYNTARYRHPTWQSPALANYESGIHKKSLLVKVFLGVFAKVSTHTWIYIYIYIYTYIYIYIYIYIYMSLSVYIYIASELGDSRSFFHHQLQEQLATCLQAGGKALLPKWDEYRTTSPLYLTRVMICTYYIYTHYNICTLYTCTLCIHYMYIYIYIYTILAFLV